ncbi:MAG: haloacid dehalogenase-like hydrolase [Proteobacteria bacterium]|nr:haloacid dehalogenase-like hydrolase [Pseudomonadota bacterium]MCH8952170.1 haloacid dehalogenase-like hydrolase [Pseudomonadota bacterium]
MKKIAVAALAMLAATATAFADPLPSWSPGDAKARIIAFVDGVTDPGGTDYVTPAERIAVFDNDGTLWAEQPMYFQFMFAVDRIADMAAEDPSIASSPVLKAAAAGDLKGALAGGKKGLLEIIAVSHSGLTVAEFDAAVRDWLATARHPTKDRSYTDLIYQPMLELLRYLRDEGFATYIVSGGGIHFIRAFAEDAYGVPPERVIGSVGETSFEIRDGLPVIVKNPAIAFIDDKAGKPVAIDRVIGRRPIFAGGNSDGDLQMLQWTTGGPGPRFALIVHHTDAGREWAYDRDSHIGRLDKALDAAAGNGWTVIDMKADWRVVYPFELE